MSAVPGSLPGGLKRSLAELLASRATKADRKAEYSSKRIQEAAVYLLSCHQDVNQFLLEIEDPACKKMCNGKNTDCKHPPKSALLPESFIGSTLRDQALHLGIPADVLGARAAVTNIQQICPNVGNNMEEVWLSQDQRDRLTAFLKTLKILKTENCFRCSVFLKQIWQQPRPPVLEVVWHLHSMDIVDIEEILESSTDMSSAVDWFCTEMRALCLHMENSSDDHEFVEQIISNLLAVLIGRAFCHSASSIKNLEQSKMTKISLFILNAMLSWLLDAVVEAGSGQSYKPGVERHWLIAYKVSRYRARVIPESLEEFFLHTLNQTLTYKPKLKVSDAIRSQGNWSFVKTCQLLTDLYRKLFVLLNAEKLTSHVQSILDTQEVNWHHVLSFFSCLVICQSEAQHLVKGLLSRLLSQAFETYELEYLITTFLIARQAALEGPAAFMSYTEWFKGTFGSPSSHQSSSKKSLVFLLKFLSDLVPFETPQYLKVHILHSPFVPTKFRSLLMEYITLAKTRLADMKVSIEDMGLYEDLSVGSDKDQPQAQQDVEKAVKIFENTGKIPASVMEASIFRRPYFTSRFLPALLCPRVLPKVPDSLMLLIDALKRADKIPANVFSSYLDACELQRHRKLEGKENMDVSLNTEPMARLQAALWELRPYVINGKQYDEISSQVAVISDRLAAVMGSVNPPSTIPVTSDGLFSCSIEELEPQELTVSDLLLTTFCQCVLAAFSANPPDRQGAWPTLYVKMLFGHRRALFALLTRMLQLLCHQAPCLKDSHVVGLAAFSVHLYECRMSLEPSGSDVPLLDKFWKTLLNPQCSDSLPVVLRFCTAAISYSCCRFPVTATDTCSDSLPPLFMCKLQHLLPRLIPEARREGMVEGMEEADTPVVFSVCPSPAWKEAALSLWCQTRVQELLKKDLFQLSFRDWLLWEMSLNPGVDPLSDMERQDYQRWAVNQSFLPKSSAVGGCGNNFEKACTTIVDAILDFNTGCEIDPGSYPSHGSSGLSGILSRLQELVCDFLCIKGKNIQGNFLLDAFHQKLEKDSNSLETGAQLGRQCKLTMCCRIVLGLPSSLLVRPYSVRGFTTLKADDFVQFVSKHLKNISQRGYALPYDITAHFFRGLLISSAQCEDPEEAVNSVLMTAYTHCPIVMTSAALWWPRLDAAIKCQWNCLHEADLPKEIETLQEMQADVDRFLSQGKSLPLTKTTWLSAAFLHFTIQRNKVPQQRLTELLGSFSSKSVQLLDCLLFFLIMDLIPLTLKGEAEHKAALEHCMQTIQCLEEKGGSWLNTFQLNSEKYKCPLHQSVSEEFLKLLPLAFFSLAERLQVESMAKQEDFLPIALEMYTQLFQLFLDGSPLLDPLQADPQTVFSKGRQFLLRCIVKSQHTGAVFRSRLPQIIDSWDEKDPELAGMLKNVLQSFENDCMYDEPDLF